VRVNNIKLTTRSGVPPLPISEGVSTLKYFDEEGYGEFLTYSVFFGCEWSWGLCMLFIV
jgi:hypothetical protein